MKLFKHKRHVTLEDIYEIQQSILTKIESKPSEREKRLEEMFFNAKAHKIVEYENQIRQLKSQIESKDTLIDQQAKTIEKIQKELKNLKKQRKGEINNDR